MTHIIIDNEHFDIPDAVAIRMTENYDGLVTNYKVAIEYKEELDALRDKVKEMRLKEDTAIAKPTEVFRMAYWKCRQELYSMIPRLRVLQKELFR